MVYGKLIGVSRLWSGVENEREGASLLPSLSCPQMELDSSLCPIPHLGACSQAISKGVDALIQLRGVEAGFLIALLLLLLYSSLRFTYHFSGTAVKLPVIMCWLMSLFNSIRGTTVGKSVQQTCALKTEKGKYARGFLEFSPRG